MTNNMTISELISNLFNAADDANNLKLEAQDRMNESTETFFFQNAMNYRVWLNVENRLNSLLDSIKTDPDTRKFIEDCLIKDGSLINMSNSMTKNIQNIMFRSSNPGSGLFGIQTEELNKEIEKKYYKIMHQVMKVNPQIIF